MAATASADRVVFGQDLVHAGGGPRREAVDRGGGQLDLAPGEVEVHRAPRGVGLGHDLVEPGRRIALRAQEPAGRADESITRVGCHMRSIAI